jgi:plasmid stabilization system protein ParE
VIGTARPDLGELHRIFTHKRWVIIFRPIAGGIEVLRVLDGSRDYPRLFGS